MSNVHSCVPDGLSLLNVSNGEAVDDANKNADTTALVTLVPLDKKGLYLNNFFFRCYELLFWSKGCKASSFGSSGTTKANRNILMEALVLLKANRNILISLMLWKEIQRTE